MDNNDFKIFGQKIAVLLDNSNLPDDIKEAWIQLIPGLNLEQLDRFLNILEVKYLDGETQVIDEQYQKKIAGALENYLASQEKNKQELLRQMQQLGQIYE